MDADAIRTAPELFARAHGLVVTVPRGRCCYCGAPAVESHVPPDSFTALDKLAAPGSGLRCPGCAAALTATAGQSPDGKPWMWSWVVTADRAARHALCAMLGGDRVRVGRAADVFAYLAFHGLPVHPNYAMLGAGRWPREYLRTAPLGGKRGDQFGRAEWEREYYGDVLRRLEVIVT
ncbi:MAG: hypothetical protein E6Q76_19695 [Rhizobium sp.]|nr:MAG: hypothetical protein E6Q76_19695 [Rhizobium sp.]